MKKTVELLNAIDAWRKADSDLADCGHTKEIDYRWDDAKDKMTTLADEVRAELKTKKGKVTSTRQKMWCYSGEDNEPPDGRTMPRLFHSLKKARAALKADYEADLAACKDELDYKPIVNEDYYEIKTIYGRLVTNMIRPIHFED